MLVSGVVQCRAVAGSQETAEHDMSPLWLLVTGYAYVDSALDLKSGAASYRDLTATRSSLREKRLLAVDLPASVVAPQISRPGPKVIVCWTPQPVTGICWSPRWRPLMPMSMLGSMHKLAAVCIVTRAGHRVSCIQSRQTYFPAGDGCSSGHAGVPDGAPWQESSSGGAYGTSCPSTVDDLERSRKRLPRRMGCGC